MNDSILTGIMFFLVVIATAFSVMSFCEARATRLWQQRFTTTLNKALDTGKEAVIKREKP